MTQSPSAANPQPFPWAPPHWLAALLLVAAAVLPFASNIEGSFVYDDTQQIENNRFIQQPELFGEALTRDVWAFKGDESEDYSNYWRPVFVLYLVLNERLFGIESTTGWHLMNLVLHALVALLLWRLMLRLRTGALAAWAVAALFAVHPVHVESVAWISGAPDPLATIGMLVAWLCLATARPGLVRWIAACLALAVALLSKEIAVVFPLLIMVYAYLWPDRAESAMAPGQADTAARSQPGAGQRLRAAAWFSAPLWAMVVVWFFARAQVVAAFGKTVGWQLTVPELLLNVPQLLLFYLQQCLLPLSLGPSYPIRAVTLETAGLSNVLLPAALLLVGFGILAYFLRHRRLFWLGLALFVLPLAPAFNLNAFLPEQIVHDRYLYLPLAGVLMMLTALLQQVGEGLTVLRGSAAQGAMPILALAVIGLAGWQSNAYSPVWGDELRLWQRGVEVDPNSAFNHSQLGVYLAQAGRNREAFAAFNRSIEMQPNAPALIGRADLVQGAGDLQAASRDLISVLAIRPTNVAAAERLAQIYQQNGDLAAAQRILEGSLAAGPRRRCSLQTNLAVVSYLQGDRERAAQLLEQAVAIAPGDRSVSCQVSYLHRGRLLQEMGNTSGAVASLQMFIEVSQRFPQLLPQRRQAERMLADLGNKQVP